MTGRFIIPSVLLLVLSCSSSSEEEEVGLEVLETDSTDFNFVLSKFNAGPTNYVMVMAHRGDKANAPENSISGINNAIAMGVDIVEMDIQITKDDVLILMHDQTLDRMTTASGNVIDYTWEEIKQLRLKNPDGSISQETVPSLEEALAAAKDKILVFIDKSYDHHDLIYDLLKTHDMTDQVMVDGIASEQQHQTDYPDIEDDFNFVPRIGLGQSAAYVDSHLSNDDNKVLFPSCNLLLSEGDIAMEVLASDRWIILSTLSSSSCSEEFSSTWSWAIDQGVDIIVTDRPVELLEYLKQEDFRK